MSATGDINLALREAHDDQATFMARVKSLARVACDVSLDDEKRLRALMEIDAAFWSRRVARRDAATGEPDKIKLARAASDRRRMVRDKAAAIAAGSLRVWKISGALAVTEPADVLRTHKCAHCGAPFTPRERIRREPLYCCPACKTAAYRARVAEALDGMGSESVQPFDPKGELRKFARVDPGGILAPSSDPLLMMFAAAWPLI